MAKTPTVEVDVKVESSTDKTTKLMSLVQEIANAAGIQLTDEQLKLLDIDWNQMVSEKGTIEIDGERYITLAELRRLARLRGYISSKPRVVQAPEYENHRQATVEWEIIWRDGTIDGSAADASWRTCNPGFRNYTVPIASNRAEARCIRAALGINTCSWEEIGPEDEDLSGPANDQQKAAIPMLITRNKIEPSMFAELFGADVAAKVTDGDSVNFNGLSHQMAVKMMGVLNKYKAKK